MNYKCGKDWISGRVDSSVGCWLLALFVLGIGATQVRAQETSLSTALELFQEGQWEASRDSLDALLGRGLLSEDQRVQAQKYLGICHILFEEHDSAKRTFKQIILQNPSFGLNTDDLRTAEGELIDEVVRVFSQSVMEVRREEIQMRQAQLSRTSRLGAFLRSTALPGWGQRYQGYAQRGFLMLSATAASIAYAAVSERAFRDERRTYRADDADADFDRRYQDFKDSGNRANLAWRLVGAVWLLNMVDAGSQGPNVQQGQGFSVVPKDSGVQVVLRSHF